MKKLLVVFFSVIIITLSFVGCGGGSSSSGGVQQTGKSQTQQTESSPTKVPAQNGLPPIPQIPES